MNNQRYFILAASDALSQRPPDLVKIERGQVGFSGHGYWIGLGLIQRRRDLIKWIHHLSQKSWVTGEMLAQFIEKVCKYRGWPIYGGTKHDG